jgi:hypothetical protein
VTELVDYALDALDGAADLVEEAHFAYHQAGDQTPGGGRGPSQYQHQPTPFTRDQDTMTLASSNSTSAAMLVSPTVCLVQDCIRHVALATNALAAVQSWGLVENTAALYLSLWKATATSFLVVESTGEPLHHNLLPVDVSESFCQSILKLAGLALQSHLSTTTSSDVVLSQFPLATTFLRVLQHPVLVQDLLYALSTSASAQHVSELGTLWSTMEQQIRTNADPDLKRVVQAAILTLASSGGNGNGMGTRSTSTSSQNSHNEHLEWQLAQALMDRLLPMLGVNCDDASDDDQYHYTATATRVASPTEVATAASTPALHHNRNDNHNHSHNRNHNRIQNQNGTTTRNHKTSSSGTNKYHAWDALFVRQWEHIMMLQSQSHTCTSTHTHSSM